MKQSHVQWEKSTYSQVQCDRSAPSMFPAGQELMSSEMAVPMAT